jgi:hypothetical protein
MKLRVKRLPRTVCISIHAPKGKTLAKRSSLKRGKRRTSRRHTRRRTKRTKTRGSIKKCAAKRSLRTCRRLARANCLTKKGTTKKSKFCRAMSRRKGLRSKSYRRRGLHRRSPLSKGGLFFGQTTRTLKDLGLLE